VRHRPAQSAWKNNTYAAAIHGAQTLWLGRGIGLQVVLGYLSEQAPDQRRLQRHVWIVKDPVNLIELPNIIAPVMPSDSMAHASARQ